MCYNMNTISILKNTRIQCLNKYISKFIDKWLLMDLHKNRSKAFQFCKGSEAPVSLDQLKLFYTTPSIPNVTLIQQDFLKDYITGKYKFKSEISSNGNCNDFSTGNYYRTTYRKQDISVILVHGWRMDSYDRMYDIYLDSFMEKKCNIYTFTLPHHFERSSDDSLYNGELFVSANIDRTLLSIKQTISDLRALILYLKENNEKVVLIGLSLGGFITNLAAIVEERIDVLISVMYANSLAFSVWKSICGKYMKKDFESHGFTYEELKKDWAILEPSNFKPVIPKGNILLFSGIHDEYVLNEDTDYLWEAWDKPQRILYPCGHAGIALFKNEIRKKSLEFLRERF